MSTITRASARRQVATFLTVTYASVLALALALPDLGLITVLMMATPTLGVLAAVAAATRRGERRDAWASLGFRRPPWRALAIAIAVPVALACASFALAGALGVAVYPNLILDPTALALELLVTGVVLALGEEIGWRGYLLPRVTVLVRGRWAALLTGVAHAVLHLPALLLTAAYQSEGERIVIVPMVCVTVTAAGVFYAWLRHYGGSLWPVALAHNAFNMAWTIGRTAAVAASPAALAYVSTETGVVTMLLAVGVAAWLWRFQGDVLDATTRVERAGGGVRPVVAEQARMSDEPGGTAP